MTRRALDFESLARLFYCHAQTMIRRRRVLADLHLLLIGYGSIAGPLAELSINEFGVKRMTLVDPKRYLDRSVASQCEPGDVGRPKVAVGTERLARHCASVEAFQRDIYAVPDGVVRENTIVVASVDNRRADIAANRMAARMGSRLLKINIEQKYQSLE